MPDSRYPTLDEFWRRLEKRKVEPDLMDALASRASQATGVVRRLGDEASVIGLTSRLLPGSAVPAEAIAHFLDENFDRPLGRADEKQGVLPRNELLPAGFRALDAAAGGSFASLDPGSQDSLISKAERGELEGPPGFDSAVWFKRLRDLVLLAFASDPRGMVQMGYPGPSYQPGHVWLGRGGIKAREARRPGYLEL